MTQSEFENWTQLQELADAEVKPSKLSTTGAGLETQLAVEHSFRCDNRGYPSRESILFGDLTPADIVKACMAPMGGLVALFPSPCQLAVTPVPELSQVTITNPSGSHEVSIKLPMVLGDAHGSGSLVAMGWAEPEVLLAVSSRGTCSVVSPKGRMLHSFQVCGSDMEVVKAHVYHSGVVSLAYSNPESPPELTLSTWQGSLQTGQIELVQKSLPLPATSGTMFECIALQAGPLVHSDVGQYSSNMQVILAPEDGGLMFCSQAASLHKALPWTAALMAVSAVTGNAIAVVTKASPQKPSCLHILDSSIQGHSTLEDAVVASVRLDRLMATSAFAFASADAPPTCSALDLAWISEAAVAVLLKQQFPGGHATRHVFVFSCSGQAAEVLLDDDEACQLAPELDGCVILGERTWSLVRDVPMAVLRALSPGTTEPAGLLVAASQYYNDRDARCESLLEAIRGAPTESKHAAGALSEAVTDCVFTAGWVHRIPLQRELLAAAIYGRIHAPHAVDASLIPLCALHARVLNSLRKPSGAGRGTTRKQLEWLIIHNRLQYIADVLCSSELFALAFDLASDQELPVATGPVLLRWAQAVIDLVGHDRQECLSWLRQRLDNAPGVSWAAVAAYALERHYLTLGEELLALDPRDRHVVPQLMRLQAYSDLALSKAMHTCDEHLTLLVLMHSFDESHNTNQATHFYAFLRGHEGGPARGVLPGQAEDVWQSFVLSLVLPLPNVTLGGLKERVFAQHYNHAPPLHRALLTFSEVVVSTAGPARDGSTSGASKGRTNTLAEWDTEQRLLQAEAETLLHPSSAWKAPVQDGVQRGISGLSGGGKGPPWWQADALKRYRVLRERQQMMEGQAKVQLVGLSVMDTARKLKATRNDALYDVFVREMLSDHGRSSVAQRNSRMRFTIECETLAKKQQFKALLDKAELEKAKGSLGDEKVTILVSTALGFGIQNDDGFERPLPSHRGSLALRERLGTVMNGMSDADSRDSLKEKLQSVCGQRGDSSHQSFGDLSNGASPALSSVGEAFLQQAGSVGAMIGQRAGQVRERLMR